MRKFRNTMLLFGLFCLLISCAGGGGSGRVYHHHHGRGPWSGSRAYDRDRVIVVPPEKEPELEATPLPSGPEHRPDVDTPDMGMPDIDLGDF